MSHLLLCSFYNIHRCNHENENYSDSIKLKVSIKVIPILQIRKWRQRGVTNPEFGFLFPFTEPLTYTILYLDQRLIP